MNNQNMIWFGRYEGWLRMLAHGVKDYDDNCIGKAAKLFDLMLPDGCVVVPMPSHDGMPRQMVRVLLINRVMSLKWEAMTPHGRTTFPPLE